MTNEDFWASISKIISDDYTPEGLDLLDRYAEHFISGGLYTNDFHRKNSLAAQREARRMSLHPYSRQQVLDQIASLRQSEVSKESSNLQRSKKKG